MPSSAHPPIANARRAAFVAVIACLAPGIAHAQDAGVDASAPASPSSITPPRLIHRAEPVYPPGADGRRVDVELLLTLDEHGAVAQSEVLGHIPADATEAFDQAARAAAATLVFAPALQDGQPVAVRIRFHLAISPPVVGVPGPDAGLGADGSVSADASAPAPEVPEQELGAGAEGMTHAHPAPADAGVDAALDAEAPDDDAGVTVSAHNVPPSRGAGDSYTALGQGLRQVPQSNASGMLRFAPGILLTNEGGEGHAEQVYLRGFDAHEGQDLEFTVNGVPINEVGNPHGEGLADTHFIIPELVHSIRVLEGPFDPHQGNFAVAGSAEYELGLDARGLAVQYLGGSWNTHRILALWGPENSRTGTFAGVELRTTDGFGTNRAARLGRAMAQWEAALGPTTTLRLLATTYATQYGSAGVIRRDDYEAGRVDFFGSYDPTQGGDATRHTLSATLEDATDERTARLQVFATLHSFRLRENYTGFLEDPPEAYRSGSAQRGDMVDQTSSGTTVGTRASVRMRTRWRDQTQSLEAGLYGRYDLVDAAQRRLRFGTVIPYRVDFDLGESIGNLGAYLDAELRPFRWVALRGGIRGDFFSYDVLSRCDLHDTSVGSATPVDQLCYDRDRTGPRDPSARRSASGLAIEPRATLLVGPFAGLTFTASAGSGARAADATYLADSSFAPFVTLVSGEAGALYSHSFQSVGLTVRALYYATYVGRDLIFNQQEGRNTLAPGTVRQGGIVAVRASSDWFDWVASVTYADARFVRAAMDPGSTYFPADQGDQVPYVPNWVVRSDAGVHRVLPWEIMGAAPLARAGLGVTYVSPRALPYGQRSDAMFVVDASASARWRWIELGLIVQNLFDNRYELGVYNYVSNFNATNPTPDMLPARHFTAGAPLGVFATLTLYLGGEGN